MFILENSNATLVAVFGFQVCLLVLRVLFVGSAAIDHNHDDVYRDDYHGGDGVYSHGGDGHVYGQRAQLYAGDDCAKNLV